MSLPVDKYPLYFLYYLETINTYLYSKPVGAWYKGAIEIIIVVTTHTITCTRYQHYNSGREHALDKALNIPCCKWIPTFGISYQNSIHNRLYKRIALFTKYFANIAKTYISNLFVSFCPEEFERPILSLGSNIRSHYHIRNITKPSRFIFFVIFEA